MTRLAGRPTIAVLVLTYGGERRLGPCLRSIAAADQPPVDLSVVVVDNGSPDQVAIEAAVSAATPDAEVMRLDVNQGFAQGYNTAIAAVAADWVLLLNDDTAVTPPALSRLWSATLGDDRVCVGARLVSWDGKRHDFDGGGAALTGHGHPLRHGRPVAGGTYGGAEPGPGADLDGAEDPGTDEGADSSTGGGTDDGTDGVDTLAGDLGPTLFCSGAAMLIRRDVYLGMGGFDPSYFAYYEDVDLGWRLWLAGQAAWHVPSAVIRHVGGATGDDLPSERRTRLHERNAIATVFKCYDDDVLRSTLPAALALAAHRAGADASVIDEAVPAQDRWPPLPASDWSGWVALSHLGLDFGALAGAREVVQASRGRPDNEVIPLLAEPYAPVPATHAAAEAMRRAIDCFELERHFGAPRAGAGIGSVGHLGAKALGALRDGGPANLVDEARRYLEWRRSGGA
ncbi:MAG: glycosyltransferase family 2 protein [Anaerolineae bacterium]